MENQYESLIPVIMYDQRITRRDLERGTGVSYPTATRIEQGEINLSLITILKVAEFLKVDWAELIVKIIPPLPTIEKANAASSSSGAVEPDRVP